MKRHYVSHILTRPQRRPLEFRSLFGSVSTRNVSKCLSCVQLPVQMQMSHVGPSQVPIEKEQSNKGANLGGEEAVSKFLTQKQFYSQLSSPMKIAKSFNLVPDLTKEYRCPVCYKVFHFSLNKNSFSCSKHFKVSFHAGTWFEKSKLSMEVIFEICWAFCEEEKYEWCIRNIRGKDGHNVSARTLTLWFERIRQVICNEVAVSGQLESPAFENEKDIVKAWKRGLNEKGESAFVALLIAISRQFKPQVVNYLPGQKIDM